MAPVLLLLVLLAEAASDLIEVTVHPGDDVTLPCRAADSSIRAVEWSRPDLQPDYVLLYRDGRPDPYHQHLSFRDRVDLVDRDLKDGDVSLTLKNVNINDTGTYECRVAPSVSRRKKRAVIDSEPIRIIRLKVTGPNGGHPKDENALYDVPEDGPSSPVGRHHGLTAGAAGGLFLVAVVAVVGVLIYKRP